MIVNVQYLGLIRNFTNTSQDEIELGEGVSLFDLINKLAEIYGRQFQNEVYEPGMKDAKMGFVVTINSVLIGQLDGADTELIDGDKVLFMSLVTGG